MGVDGTVPWVVLIDATGDWLRVGKSSSIVCHKFPRSDSFSLMTLFFFALFILPIIPVRVVEFAPWLTESLCRSTGAN